MKAKAKAAKKKEADEAAKKAEDEKENKKAEARAALEKAEAGLMEAFKEAEKEEKEEESRKEEEVGYKMEIHGDKLSLAIPVEVMPRRAYSPAITAANTPSLAFPSSFNSFSSQENVNAAELDADIDGDGLSIEVTLGEGVPTLKIELPYAVDTEVYFDDRRP